MIGVLAELERSLVSERRARRARRLDFWRPSDGRRKDHGGLSVCRTQRDYYRCRLSVQRGGYRAQVRRRIRGRSHDAEGISGRPLASILATQSACGNPHSASDLNSRSKSHSTLRMVGVRSSSNTYEARRSPSCDRLTLPAFTTVIPVTRRTNDR